MRRKLAGSSISNFGAVLLVAITCFSMLIVASEAEQVSSRELFRTKRQNIRRAQASAISQTQPLASGGGSIAASTAPQAVPSNVKEPELAEIGDEDAAVAEIDDGSQKTPPPRRRPTKGKRKKPAKQQKPSRHDEEDEDDEDQGPECNDDEDEEDYYDYRQMFDGLMRRPMNQFGRMMGNAFDRMQEAYEDTNNYRPSSRSLATAMTDGRGYSKAVSSVTNNGRTRGIISETRDGKTKFTPIGQRGKGRDDVTSEDEE